MSKPLDLIHRCNPLCSDGEHSDLFWSEPTASEVLVASIVTKVYGVIVTDVRRVEDCPPNPDDEDPIHVYGKDKPMDEWSGVVSFGVRWKARPVRFLAAQA